MFFKSIEIIGIVLTIWYYVTNTGYIRIKIW